MSIEQWSDLMFPEREGTVTPIYGSVRAINDDGSYEVQLNASSVTTRCAPCCTAMVGDRVLVLIKPNGKCDAIGRLGGDLGGGGTIVTQYDDASNYIAGRVFAYAGTDEPIGCLLCDGRAVSRTTYWELFDAIGTTYGAGDGSSTFNLPNIESRTIIGESDSYALGATGGEEKHTLVSSEIPSVLYTGYRASEPTDRTEYGTFSGLWRYGSTQTDSIVPTLVNSGGDQPHNNMQPYIVMRYFITTGKGDPASGINPADYVVEWGQTDGWRWEKWASGKAECWKKIALDFGGWNAWGAVYETDTCLGRQTFPFEFTEEPNLNVSASSELGGLLSVEPVGVVTKYSTPEFYATRPTTYAGQEAYDIFFDIQVKGFWKSPSASGGTETIAPTIEARFAELEARLAEAEYDTGWENVYYIDDSMYIKARRVGKQVTVVGHSGGYYELTPNEYANVTTLPEKFRPSFGIEFTKHNLGGDPTADSNYITPEGLIRMYTTVSGNRYWGFSVSYPVD